MKKYIMSLLILLSVISMSVCYATGNLVNVDGGMGTVVYADRNTVEVLEYNPPFYTIKIDYIRMDYNYNPPRQMNGGTIVACYNWDNKNVIAYTINGGEWKYWDITQSHDHASGNPLIPLSVETAFVTAYNMKFWGNMLCQPPHHAVGKEYLERFYHNELGI